MSDSLRSSDPNDPDIEEDILNLVKEKFDEIEESDIDVFYEHGQWWARVEVRDGDQETRTFSVVDCERNGEDYLDLEEV